MVNGSKEEPRGFFAINSLSPLWRFLCLAGLGLVAGLSLVVANVGRAASYLYDDPETCVNCHVMNPQYATWQHSSHGRVTNCNDCHVPHNNFVNHYAFKAMDGVKHSFMFAWRLEPQVIELSEGAVSVIEENCKRCHQHQVEMVSLSDSSKQGLQCWDCHRDVPHGTVRSLSATPTQMRPTLPHAGLESGEMKIGTRTPRSEEGTEK